MVAGPKPNLLADVEAFLKTHGLSATRFGVLAAGDTKFVNTLRKGRRVRSATEQRVRDWMKSAAPAEAGESRMRANGE